MYIRWMAAVGTVLLAASAQADPKGDALLKKVRAATAKIRSLQADVDLKVPGDQQLKARFEGMRPNLGRVVMTGEPFGEIMRISTGTELYLVVPSEKQYQKMEGGSGVQMLEFLPGSPIAAFYRPADLGKGQPSKLLGARKIGGKSYQALQLSSKSPPMTQVLFVNASGLVEGSQVTMSGGGQKQTISIWLRNMKLNAPLTPAQFAYTPPADFTMPKGPEEALLAVGTQAPDFLLSQPGKPGAEGLYGLEMARKEKKAVLVNFWFYS